MTTLGVALDAAIVAIDSLGARYALVGGLAVSAWGVVRATRDVDLYVERVRERADEIQAALAAQAFDVPAMLEELESFGVFRALHQPTRVFIDMFDADNPLGMAVLDRRTEVSIEGHKRWVSSVEDLVLLKAFSDRERDFDDLAKLLAIRGNRIDRGYVDRWARDLDASIGSDEVGARIRAARDAAKKLRPK